MEILLNKPIPYIGNNKKLKVLMALFRLMELEIDESNSGDKLFIYRLPFTSSRLALYYPERNVFRFTAHFTRIVRESFATKGLEVLLYSPQVINIFSSIHNLKVKKTK